MGGGIGEKAKCFFPNWEAIRGTNCTKLIVFINGGGTTWLKAGHYLCNKVSLIFFALPQCCSNKAKKKKKGKEKRAATSQRYYLEPTRATSLRRELILVSP
uniref:Uncharacterized protein n=1 Tax=Acrobeloides nanus TaxID=290746 RepID=A0A914D3F8_9BILA